MSNWEELEEFEKQKTKVMNYIMYKKRTEFEVKQKFSKTIDEDTLEKIIDYIDLLHLILLNNLEYIEYKVNNK